MGGVDEVSKAIGSLQAESKEQTRQLTAIFGKLDELNGSTALRNERTAERLKSLEDDQDTLKRDVEKLTEAIDGLSGAIANAKTRGWKMVAMFFAIAATSGGGSAALVSAFKGVLFP
jgi:cob(I)alamin adenosyltransferase